MTTLNDDLATAYLWAKSRFQRDVEIVDAVSVYINFDFRCAVTITPQYEPEGKVWIADVTEWDASGGVHMEIPLSSGSFTDMTLAVSAWLDTWDQQQLELEALMLESDAYISGFSGYEQEAYSREAQEESLGRPLFPNEY